MKPQLILACAALLIGGACSGDSTAPDASIVGAYTLQTVGGAALPIAFSPDVDLTGSKFVILDESNFVDTLYFQRHLSDGTLHASTGHDSGTYTRSGATLTVVYDSDNEHQQVTVSGRTLTIHTDATAAGDYVYRR